MPSNQTPYVLKDVQLSIKLSTRNRDILQRLANNDPTADGNLSRYIYDVLQDLRSGSMDEVLDQAIRTSTQKLTSLVSKEEHLARVIYEAARMVLAHSAPIDDAHLDGAHTSADERIERWLRRVEAEAVASPNFVGTLLESLLGSTSDSRGDGA